jgi:hypothetical protein
VPALRGLIARLQQIGRRSHILHSRIEPQGIVPSYSEEAAHLIRQISIFTSIERDGRRTLTKRRKVTTGMKQPNIMDGKVLDFRLRNFLGWYQGKLSLAVKHVNERFAWRIGSLVDDHGAPALDAALKNYRIAVKLPANLHEAFGATIMPYLWPCDK